MNNKFTSIFFRSALYVLLFILGLNGLAGGALLYIKPDGSLLHMDPSWLSNTIFSNYFIPGILLFTLIGVFTMVTLFGLITKKEIAWLNAFNIYPNRHWAWTFSVYSSIITLCWITIQQMISQFFWIQPVISAFGILILICTLLPSVMHFYEMK